MSYVNNLVKQLCMSLEKSIITSRRSTLKSETLLSLAVVCRRFFTFRNTLQTEYEVNRKQREWNFTEVQ